MERRRVPWWKLVVHVAALAPLAVLTWMAWQKQLGPAPVAAATRLLGRYALVLLLLSLVPTAVRIVTGFDGLLPVRRSLGLYAFLYAAAHVLSFAGLEYRFDLRLIATTVAESRREILGLGAFLILALLAVTSMRGLMKRVGTAWKTVHRLVYLAAILVVLHYVWNYKELRAWPLAAGTIVLLLLIVRIPPAARLFRRWRDRGERSTEG